MHRPHIHERIIKMKRKIGINADCFRDDSYTYGDILYGHIKKLRECGFEHFFVGKLTGSFFKYKAIAESIGMSFDFIHAPFKGINDMWLEGDGYLTIYNGMKSTVDLAATHAVPMVIFHVSSGWEPPATCELGFKRFDELVDYAESKGVIVAFENLRGISNLLEIMERYKDREYVKYCYDCGHEFAYTPEIDWIKTFGDKLACVHIHDNLGYDRSIDPDFHYLPFDGKMDYEDMVRRLDEVGYEGPIMLEVFNTTKPEYKTMTEDEFFKLCAEKATRIAEMG